MISKKLLSEILGKKVKSFDPFPIIDEKHIAEPTLLMVVLEDGIDLRGVSIPYNFYELTHRIERKIIDYGYEISVYVNKSDYQFDLIGECSNSGDWGCTKASYIVETKFDGYTKLLQWVLENKENND